MNNENMYFDPAQFDFDSLTDVIDFDNSDDANAHSAKAKEQIAQNRTNHMGGKVDDISDLGLNVPTTLYDEDYEEDDDANEEYDDTSDLTEELSSEAHINSFNDDTVYTLDDGSTLTGADLKELSRERNTVKTQSEWFSGAQAEYDKESKAIAHQLMYDKAAVDINYDWLQEQMQKAKTDHERGELYRQIKEVESTRRAVEAKAQDIMRSQAQRENMLLDVRHQKADYHLDRQYKGEYSKNKSFFTNYAIQELGIPANELDRSYSVGLMNAIMESYKFREMGRRSKDQETAFINKAKVGHAKSVQSANKVKTEKQAKAQASRAIANMGTSRKANVDAFMHLKD